MATTKIADVIVPEVFAPYIREEIIEKSAIIKSGIITQNPQLSALVTGGGRVINMPIWSRLTGQSQVLSDQKSIEVNKIATKQDKAALILRANAWGAHELAGALAGDSPMDAIASMVAEWWARDEQRTLISILTGVFNSPTMSGHVYDRSSDPIDAKLTLGAKQLLGDAANQLATIIMHSATFTNLQQNNFIQYIADSSGQYTIPTYLGYVPIVDDTVPNDGTTYTTYLMAGGVIARGEGTPVDMTPVETDRDSLDSTDILVNRRAFVMHPLGVAFTDSNVADSSPTNAELEDGDNWEKVYDTKHIGMVKILHALGN